MYTSELLKYFGDDSHSRRKIAELLGCTVQHVHQSLKSDIVPETMAIELELKLRKARFRTKHNLPRDDRPALHPVHYADQYARMGEDGDRKVIGAYFKKIGGILSE